MEQSGASRILIVEDEDQIRRLLLAILRKEGYEVLPANSAQQALDLLDRHPVDLILLDLHMPGPADGEDLLYLLRDRGDEVPIIVVSGWVDDEVVANRPDCVYAVIKKPIQTEAFLRAVRQALIPS